MDRFTESRSNPHELIKIITTIIKLRTGSRINQLVCIITTPAITTPKETAASAVMCKKAPFILRSCFCPEINNRAVKVFITTPIAATIIITNPSTGCGSNSRSKALKVMPPKATSSKIALDNEARIVTRRKP